MARAEQRATVPSRRPGLRHGDELGELAEVLSDDGVSCIFAGATHLDFGLALKILNAELGVERLLLEGRGHVTGSFLRVGLVDEVSLIIWPAVDGAAGAPSVFNSIPAEAGHSSPVRAMHLLNNETTAEGAV